MLALANNSWSIVAVIAIVLALIWTFWPRTCPKCGNHQFETFEVRTQDSINFETVCANCKNKIA